MKKKKKRRKIVRRVRISHEYEEHLPVIVLNSFHSPPYFAFVFVLHLNDWWTILHRLNQYVRYVENSLDYQSWNDRYVIADVFVLMVTVVDENSRRTIVTIYRQNLPFYFVYLIYYWWPG